jgi:hypothetical protein
LTEADGRTLKPPATAYAETEDWLVGARMVSCSCDLWSTWRCELSRPGYRAWVVWNPVRTSEFKIPETWRVNQRRDLSAKRFPLKSGAVLSIGSTPVLLESQDSNASPGTQRSKSP